MKKYSEFDMNQLQFVFIDAQIMVHLAIPLRHGPGANFVAIEAVWQRYKNISW